MYARETTNKCKARKKQATVTKRGKTRDGWYTRTRGKLPTSVRRGKSKQRSLNAGKQETGGTHVRAGKQPMSTKRGKASNAH